MGQNTVCDSFFGYIEDKIPSPESPEEEELLGPLARSTILEPGGRTPVLSSFDPFNQEELWREPTTEPEQQTPETTCTSDSYTTALVISEPLEHLYEELTKRKKYKSKEVNIMSLGEGPSDLEMNPPTTGGPSNSVNTNPFRFPPPLSPLSLPPVQDQPN